MHSHLPLNYFHPLPLWPPFPPTQSGKDLGFLMNPGEGAIPTIQFYSPQQQQAGNLGAQHHPAPYPSHMLSGSADGSISVWQAGGQWDHLKLMKGHRGEVNSIAVHCSGKLALSTAR